MNIQEAIEHTKDKGGMKVSMSGIVSRITEKRKGSVSAADRFMLDGMEKHYQQAREAWLKGDIETVAEFFGLYV